jgi:hypothetical protein
VCGGAVHVAPYLSRRSELERGAGDGPAEPAPCPRHSITLAIVLGEGRRRQRLSYGSGADLPAPARDGFWRAQTRPRASPARACWRTAVPAEAAASGGCGASQLSPAHRLQPPPWPAARAEAQLGRPPPRAHPIPRFGRGHQTATLGRNGMIVPAT